MAPSSRPVNVLARVCIAALLSVLHLGTAGAAGGPPAPEADLSGSYQGEVLNGEDMDTVLTAFSRDKSGQWTGTYAVGEEEDIETGTLDDCAWEAAFLLHCHWNDKYGRGAVRLLFTGDYGAFTGFWGDTAETTQHPWTGARQR